MSNSSSPIYTSPHLLKKYMTTKLGLYAKKLVTEIRNIEIDLVTQIPQWLEQNGFVDLNIKKRGLPLSSWGGDLGKVGLEATVGFWRAVKVEFMKAGEFGLVANEEECKQAILVGQITVTPKGT
jgi:hypothetical protein